MNRKSFLFRTIAICAIASAVLFTACKKSNVNNTDPTAAGLMAFNLAPSKAVSVSIGGNVLPGSPLQFNSYTGTYLPIFPGTRIVESFDYSNSSSLATATDSFEVGKFYSVFVVGSGSTFQNVIVNDNFDALTSSGQAFVRYVNGINGAANTAVTISGSSVNNSSAAFGSVSDFVAVTPGSTTVTVNDGASVNINRTITTEANTVYTVLLANGATSSDSAQIKYIVNGTLNGVSGQRVSSAPRITTIK